MKKSKFAIVIALGLVLCLLCGVTTTFSWFSRPRTESGDSLRWSGQYKISNGQNISIKTVESSDDGSTFGENAVTDFGGSLQAGKRRYFCTEISNSGNAEQNVSLFIKGLKTSGTASASGLYVGVNKPLKTYRLIMILLVVTVHIRKLRLKNTDFILIQTMYYLGKIPLQQSESVMEQAMSQPQSGRAILLL